MEQAFGRKATASEIKAIEERLAGTMRRLAAKDAGAWLATPVADRVQQAARTAAGDVQVEAELKLRRQALQVVALARLQDARASFPGTPLEWLDRTVAFEAGAKGSVGSLEYRAKAIQADAVRQLLDTLEATDPRFFGLIEDRAGVRDLVRELFGEKTNNPVAANGAAKYHGVTDPMRERFNRGGGKIGHLEDWGMPHHHSQGRVARAGEATWRAGLSASDRSKAVLWDRPPPPRAARDAWVNDVMSAVDRKRYVHEDGRPFDDAELRAMLGEMHTTIATGGVNKVAPGQYRGSGMQANRGSEARQLHFKSADAFMDYQARYGEKSIYDVLVGHLYSLAREIAAVETFGPNADASFRLLRDQAVAEMTLAQPAEAGQVRKHAQRIEAMYNLATGRTLPVASARMARFFDRLRSALVANRLGAAAITAITDEGTMMRMAAVNHLPQIRLWANELKAFNPTNQQEKRMANRAGLALNTMVESLNRFGDETLGRGWSSKIASATLRASGLNASTEARRRAWGVTMMDTIGWITREHASLAELDSNDHRILLSKGITDTDFEVWRRADLEDWDDGNTTMLTPDAIYRLPDARLADLGDPQALREEATTRLLSVVLEETDMAVIEPGIRERSITGAGAQRGTLTGELQRSAWLFKSFSLAMILKQWNRALSEPTGGRRVRALASLVSSTTLLGMVALQASAIRDGKDPLDATDARTWMAAMLKGGALSIFGDFMFSEQTQSGR
ncbi:MAG: hypothetical protein ABIP61_16870, partial [Burkholderiaceae bacterium]